MDFDLHSGLRLLKLKAGDPKHPTLHHSPPLLTSETPLTCKPAEKVH